MLALLWVLTGAEPPVLPRLAGQGHARPVAMALELALLAHGDWDAVPGSLDEARALLDHPEASPDQVRELALEAAGAWSGRSEPARRLYAAWARLEQVDERAALTEAEGAVGQLARLALVAAYCDALQGSTHLPPTQAASLLAASVGARSAVDGLGLAGQATEGLEPTTLLGAQRLLGWQRMLAEARLPGPLPAGPIPVAQGSPLHNPVAPLLRVGAEDVILSSRGLVSWQAGALVLDPGPPPERLDRWSSSAWQRWQVIAQRRAELSLGGITKLAPPGSRSGGVVAPNLLADGDLPAARLVEVAGWLAAEGVAELCLVVRPSEVEAERAVCAPFAAQVPPDEPVWRLGVGGLYADAIPSGATHGWVIVDDGARVDDLMLALEEARHAGRSLGLAEGG